MSGTDSPYQEHEDEARPCPTCGGTHWIGQGFAETCPDCGPPSPPDPARQARLARDTAASMRRHASACGMGWLRRQYEADAQFWDKRAEALEKLA